MSIAGQIRYRAWRFKHRLAGERNRAVILMYHRIRSEKPDPWELCVTPEHFAQHLRVLRQSYEVHPLSRLKETVAAGGRRNKVFITFDDGCLDNDQAAAPLLTSNGFTATFFIPSRNLEDPSPFWWEVLDQLFWINPALPARLELGCRENSFVRDVEPALRRRDPRVEEDWSANFQPAPSPRCSLYVELCDWIKQRTVAEQRHITGQLADAAGDYGADPAKFGKMPATRILRLAREGFEIGAHSVNHPALGHQPAEVQRSEMALGKASLEKLTGRPVTSLAYPHGDLSADTAAIAAACGFSEACTVNAGVIAANPDMHRLPRMLVRNLDGSGFKKQLHLFFTLRQ
jgi:peptidoglycan/xylan/chitin deacetylase (PgdA/CDA1 family)